MVVYESTGHLLLAGQGGRIQARVGVYRPEWVYTNIHVHYQHHKRINILVDHGPLGIKPRFDCHKKKPKQVSGLLSNLLLAGQSGRIQARVGVYRPEWAYTNIHVHYQHHECINVLVDHGPLGIKFSFDCHKKNQNKSLASIATHLPIHP